MNPDPLIDEIRRVRHKISAECGHDPKRLVEYYLRLEEELRGTGEFQFADDLLTKRTPVGEEHR